jgi:hypothetical protein
MGLLASRAERLRKIAWLSTCARLLAAHARVRVSTRVGLDDLVAQLTPKRRPARALDDDALHGVLRAEALIARLPGPRPTCLPKALARYAALRGSGVDVDFVVGVAGDLRAPRGHAWVEHAGAPVMDDEAQNFIVSFRHPTSATWEMQ